MKMIKKLLPWLIYLSGCFVSYPMGRQVIKNQGFGYTVSDRRMVIVFSTFSWISCIAFGIYFIRDNYFPHNDTPAKW